MQRQSWYLEAEVGDHEDREAQARQPPGLIEQACCEQVVDEEGLPADVPRVGAERPQRERMPEGVAGGPLALAGEPSHTSWLRSRSAR